MFDVRKFLLQEVGLILPCCFYLLINKIFVTSIERFSQSRAGMLVMLCCLLFFMLQCAFNIVHHAHYLAQQFGEPQGTLILTLAVTTIEISMVLSLLSKTGSLTAVRDTTFAVVLMGINGFAGLSLLIGGLKYNSQYYNLEGVSSYLALMICLAILCLVLPFYLPQAGIFSPQQAVVMSIICYVLYVMFLVKQTITHRHYFEYSASDDLTRNLIFAINKKKIIYNGAALLLGLWVMISLSKNLSHHLDDFISCYQLPKKLGGFIVASLVLAPEGVSAVLASYRNKLQRSINLCLGSALASLSMTLPTLLLYSMFCLRQKTMLGIDVIEQIILLLTCLIAWITFTSKKTSYIYGMILLAILIMYFSLLFS